MGEENKTRVKKGEVMSFANRLKQAMNEMEISQNELAEKIGKGKSSISQYISGKNIPKADVQEKIAEVLGCTVEFLNSEDNEEIKLNRVSVAQCAKILNVNQQSVRIALQQGKAPYGYAFIGEGKKYNYHISPKKLKEYIGALYI